MHTETICKNNLFSVCRTFGIPARLNPETQIPEYNKNGQWLRAGFEAEAISQPEKGLLKLTDKGNAVAATASGDSMSPTINDGDTIHIDLGRKTIKDGKIFAVSFGGLQYAKRLYNLPFGGVRIVSDNEDEFEEIRMTADEAKMQEFQIIGWIWQIAKLEKW